MRRILGICTVFAVMLFALGARAGAAEKMAMKMAGKPQTITGEVVDMGCYMGHGAKGAGHKDCAMKCVANGMPMGLLTDKGMLYVLTMNHENADPFNKTKEWAGEKVKVTGAVSVRNGTKSLQVDSAEPAVMAMAK
jgi:uncharacterized protein YabE (DUF348 family)